MHAKCHSSYPLCTCADICAKIKRASLLHVIHVHRLKRTQKCDKFSNGSIWNSGAIKLYLACIAHSTSGIKA